MINNIIISYDCNYYKTSYGGPEELHRGNASIYLELHHRDESCKGEHVPAKHEENQQPSGAMACTSMSEVLDVSKVTRVGCVKCPAHESATAVGSCAVTAYIALMFFARKKDDGSLSQRYTKLKPCSIRF